MRFSTASRKKKRLRRIPLNRFPFTPSTYPGRRPRFSFLFTSKGIYRLKVSTLDRVLASRNLPPATQRYAVLAYGSNACPGQLQRKNLNDVPVFYGRLIGAEAVYANRTAKAGYVPATLVRKKGSRSSWVTLLTAEQLATLDGSEGRPNVYALAEIPATQFVVGHSQVTPLYTYVDIRGRVMTIDGKPVSLRLTNQKRAKSMLPTALAEDATRWLDFESIPSPNPPGKCSNFLQRFVTSKHPNR